MRLRIKGAERHAIELLGELGLREAPVGAELTSEDKRRACVLKLRLGQLEYELTRLLGAVKQALTNMKQDERGWRVSSAARQVLQNAVNYLQAEPCKHDPMLTDGAIGMYHCPECGEMVLAGVPHPEEVSFDPDELTCAKCDLNTTCVSAFDVYNTDGDCIMEK